MRKLDPKEVSKKAVKLFKEKGYMWSEAVFSAVAENLLSEIPVNLASCFGGGIGGKKHLCGAIAGAILALGIKYGRKNLTKEEKLKAFSASSKLYEKFKETFYSVECWELTNCEQDEKKRKQEICPKYVEKATFLAVEIINEEG